MRGLLLAALFAATAVVAEPASDVRANYLFSCRGCHLADGRGVPPDVPTLRETLGDLVGRPGGRGYLVRVPGVLQSRLDDDALAEVLNYILTEFNAATLPAGFKPYTEQEVARARQQVLADPGKYRLSLVEASPIE